MAKIYISILSEQTIPNVLFLKEQQKYDKLLFISTRKTSKARIYEHVVDVLGIRKNENVQQLIVVEDDLMRIENDLARFSKTPFLNSNDDIYVNLTGGTKMMAIGVYDYFKKFDNAKFFYLPFGKNTYKQVYPKNSETHINYRLSVREYLNAYGIEITNEHELSSDREKAVNRFDLTKQMLDNYLDDEKSDKIRKLAANMNKVFRNIYDETKYEVRDIYNAFAKALPGDLYGKNEYGGDEIKYITGGWLEEYVYNVIKNILPIKADVETGIKINKNGLENEFDVMFTLENVLHVVECKTGFFNLENSLDRKKLVNTLYKLSALKDNFGLAAKMYLITTWNVTEKDEEFFKPYFAKSKSMDISLADKRFIKYNDLFQWFCDKLNIQPL